MSYMEEEAVHLYLVSSTFLKVMKTHELQILHGKSTLERVSNTVYCCINGVFREVRHDSAMNII